MIVRAPRPNSNFYILDKTISDDKKLSWAARGLLIHLLGKPDHWQVSPANLVNETRDSGAPLGRDGVYRLLQQLIVAGYIQYDRRRDEGGTLREARYLVGESPKTPLPDQAKPDQAKQTQASTDKKQELKSEQEKNDDESACVRDGVTFDIETGFFGGIGAAELARLTAANPAADVGAELLRASLWLQSHPEKRDSGYLRFLTNWMTRAKSSGAPSDALAPTGADRKGRTVSEKRSDWTAGLYAAARRRPEPPADAEFIDTPL